MDPPPNHADPLARPDPRCEAVYSICSSALNFVVGLQMPFSVGLQMPCCCCLCCCCVGRKCLSVCNTVCCFVPLHRCRRINAMSVSHTHRDTIRPRPTCEIRPTGMSLLEGEGWPSQKSCDGLRRDVASHCARAREVQRRVAANRHTQHVVKSYVPRRAVSSRLPMPPPPRVYA